MNINLSFSSHIAEKFFNCSKRNILWVSGYGAGKTWAAWQKFLVLMLTYPGYRVAACRKSRTELNRTTKQTFYKVCPQEYITRDVEGMTPQTELFNGSRIYWMNIDQFSESALKSLEINGVLVDQAEEVIERVYLTLDSRVGRWDQVEIPSGLKDRLTINPFTGKPQAPAYHVLLANPPDEGEFSWLYSIYDHDGFDTFYEDPECLYKESYSHAFFESSSNQNKALNQETLGSMMTRDEEWIEKYVKGKRTQGSGAIHRINQLSILDVDEEWVKQNLLKKAALYRVLDHGATAPTCCTWWAALNGQHFCYREYYKPNGIISQHRQAIAELSGNEYYNRDVADPSIFSQMPEKKGGFWSVADEYADPTIYVNKFDDAPPIHFQPADNNEFATRNRLNELLALSETSKHPIDGSLNAPNIYFLRRNENLPWGVDKAITETASQKKTLLDTINGKPIYSDERDKAISDHSYDTVRYYVAMHFQGLPTQKPKPKPNSFIATMKRLKALKQAGMIN